MTIPQITALVPIKGASERVPGKNLRDFCGKPLLCRVLQTLQNSGCIRRIVVNTDNDTVAALATAFPKVIIHERPDALQGHTVPMNAILAYELQRLGEGHYLQTHVTNPMLAVSTIEDALRVYFAGIERYDSLYSVVAHQSRFFTADYRPLNHDPAVLLNTQALPPLYEENSCLYVFSHSSFLASDNNRIGKNPRLYSMAKLESLDIDTEDDFRLAEVAWKAFREQ